MKSVNLEKWRGMIEEKLTGACDDVTEMKKKQDEYYNIIIENFQKQDEKFASREELNETKNDVSTINNRLWWAITAIATTAVGFFIWFLQRIGELHIGN